MRILVTGGAGFIGSHLCEKLLHEGHNVICVDNLLTGSLENIAALQSNEHFDFVEHDIINPLQIDGQIDQIYNLACPASPVDYEKLPLETLFASAYGTKNILDLAVEKKATFLHASTSEVYGDPLDHPQKESYFGNVNCLGPRSCYDEGKRYAESLIVNYAEKYHLDVKIVRIFNTYGPRMRKNDGRVIPNFIQQALLGQSLTLCGDGSQTRSFCYVSDMIDGILAMMAKNDFRGPVNLGNSSEISILSLAEQIIRLTKSKSALVHKPLPADDPKVRRPDISLAQALLHFQPRIDLEEGLQMTVDWFKNN